MSGWKGNLKFGCGTAKGASLTGFHTGPAGIGMFSGLLFRGDSRAPTKWFGTGLFKGGFHLHAAGVTVAGRVTSAEAQVHCDHGTTRGVVSASKSVKIGCYWAISGAHHAGEAEGWVYAIYVENEKLAGCAVENLQGEQGRDAAAVQAEIMLKDIPGSMIYAARKAKVVGGHGNGVNSLIGAVELNPNYTGTNFTMLGPAMADPEWALFSSAADPTPCQ